MGSIVTARSMSMIAGSVKIDSNLFLNIARGVNSAWRAKGLCVDQLFPSAAIASLGAAGPITQQMQKERTVPTRAAVSYAHADTLLRLASTRFTARMHSVSRPTCVHNRGP